MISVSCPHCRIFRNASRRVSDAVRRTRKRCDISVAAGSATADLAPLKQKLMDVTATKPDSVFWMEEARPVLDGINEAVSADDAPEVIQSLNLGLGATA